MTGASPRQLGRDPSVGSFVTALQASQSTSKMGYPPMFAETLLQFPSVDPAVTLTIGAMTTEDVTTQVAR